MRKHTIVSPPPRTPRSRLARARSPDNLARGVVLVETLAGLLPEPARVDHALEQHGWPVLAVARARLQRLLDREHRVKPNAAGRAR